MTASGYWRVRQCPACGYTDRAGKFKCLDFGARWDRDDPARRECPNCGYVNTTRAFRDVRERHKAIAATITRQLVKQAEREPEQLRWAGGLWEAIP